MASFTEENYLKAIFKLADQNSEVSISDLSIFLKVSKPTVNSMVKNLQKNGWLNYEKYKPLSLTKKGEKLAGLVVRKHRLTEMFLVEKMGFSWEEVHEIAEQVEHIQSPLFFDRMDELLGFPSADPHGSPIPDKEGVIEYHPLRRLKDASIGEILRFAGLTNSSIDFLKYLNGKNIELGIEIRVLKTEPYDGSMTVKIGEKQKEVLSSKVCEQLLVKSFDE
ncbi:metal-dependent transcriptional regulator [Namhaeicola litoreus]|uniref:Transcriptional regulator MntR n=1 Tax=Namhaeicola litoreus TaxID=1052145 RepID=A0ABW3Y246_9FLAO